MKMNKHTINFFINEVGMPKHLVFMMKYANKFPDYVIAKILIRGSHYLDRYYHKVGADEYEKAMSKLRHPAYKGESWTRKNVI